MLKEEREEGNVQNLVMSTKMLALSTLRRGPVPLVFRGDLHCNVVERSNVCFFFFPFDNGKWMLEVGLTSPVSIVI